MDQINKDTELFIKAENAILQNDDLKAELAELRPLAQLAKVIIRLQDFNDLTKEEWLETRAECRSLKKRIEELEG